MALYLSNVINISAGDIIPPRTEVVSVAKTLVANGPVYFVDTTSGSFTITLPATPNVNDRISIYDAVGVFETNSPVVARNGNLIMGEAEDLTLDVNNSKIEVVYIGASSGWRVYLG